VAAAAAAGGQILDGGSGVEGGERRRQSLGGMGDIHTPARGVQTIQTVRTTQSRCNTESHGIRRRIDDDAIWGLTMQ
jgi:hypothetical protein